MREAVCRSSLQVNDVNRLCVFIACGFLFADSPAESLRESFGVKGQRKRLNVSQQSE